MTRINGGNTMKRETEINTGPTSEDSEVAETEIVELREDKGHDQRKHRRLSVLNVNMQSEIPLARKVTIINISAGGVLVKTDRRLNIGNTYLLKIGYKDNLLFTRALVKWSFLMQSIEDEHGNIVPLYMAGMNFTEVRSGKGEGVIESILSDLEADASQFIENAELDEGKGHQNFHAESAAYGVGIETERIVCTEEKESPQSANAESLDMIIGRIDHAYTRFTEHNLTHYELLEINDSADDEEIKKAYYKKVKEFHPDRHFNLPPAAKEKLNAIFSCLNDVYETLMNEDQRENYDRTLIVRRTKNMSNRELAHQYFEQGKIEFWNGNFSEAEILFQHALYLCSASAKYFYYYAKTLLKVHKFREAEKAIREALKADPYNSDYLTEAGYIYHALGLSARAEENFEMALGVEPSHIHAQKGIQGIRNSRENPGFDENILHPMKAFRKIITG
jgi:tetratricopeptide (TPR) repeat protein